MSKANATNPVIVPQAPAPYALKATASAGVAAQAVALSTADSSFANALEGVATALALVMDTAPSFDHWEAVSAGFQVAYTNARKCTPETSRKRWVAVCAEMERLFALEKPAKPTAAAAKKAEQRSTASETAKALIAKAGATTPAAVLALSQAGVTGPVIKALAAAAGDMAASAGKAATEAAKAAAAGMREEIRKSLTGLTNAQLEQVRALVQSFAPAPNLTPVGPTNVISDAAAAVGLEALGAAV